MTNQPLSYRAITTSSNLEPISIEVRRRGVLVDLEGFTGTITVRDEQSRELIVDEATLTFGASKGRVEYYFTGDEVAKIKRDGTWLVEWHLIGPTGRALRTIPARLPVRVKL